MVDSLLEIIIERGSQRFYKPIRCPHCDKCYGRDWGKYGFSCGYIFCGWVVNKSNG